MYTVMKRVGDGMLQSIGCDFGEECKYLPIFPEVSHALAWVNETGYEWHFISKVGFNYEPGCIVMHNEKTVTD